MSRTNGAQPKRTMDEPVPAGVPVDFRDNPGLMGAVHADVIR